MSWSKMASAIGPTRCRSRRRPRISSWAKANGMAASSASPHATLLPSGTKRSTASRMESSLSGIPQLVPLDLAGGGLGQVVQEHHLAGPLEGGQPLAAELDQLLGAGAAAGHPDHRSEEHTS